jgi:hypothetical protein
VAKIGKLIEVKDARKVKTKKKEKKKRKKARVSYSRNN